MGLTTSNVDIQCKLIQLGRNGNSMTYVNTGRLGCAVAGLSSVYVKTCAVAGLDRVLSCEMHL